MLAKTSNADMTTNLVFRAVGVGVGAHTMPSAFTKFSFIDITVFHDQFALS
jgi:hypothetical protein